MIDIATHIRIFDPAPTDDLVEKRTASLKDIRSVLTKKRAVPELFQTANNLACLIADGVSDTTGSFVKDIELAIRNESKAFVAEGEELQLAVCAQLATLQLLKDASTTEGEVQIADIIGIGLWSALTFQTPRSETKLEALRSELLQQCQKVVLTRAEATRRRFEVPDVSFDEPEETDVAAIGGAVKTGLKDTIDALRINAAVDREEIDLLWWVLANWSKLLGTRFSSSKNLVSVAVASGLEVGKMLRGMPSDAHQHLALSHVGKMAAISLVDLLTKLGDDAKKLAAPYIGNTILMDCPEIFPLLTALISGSAVGKNGEVKRSLHEWAARAMLESAALHVTAHLPRMAI